MNCCMDRKFCCEKSKKLSDTDGRVEIRATKRKNQKGVSFCVDWHNDDVRLHEKCWNRLVDVAHDETRKENAIVLGKGEKKMILEAEETAEYHEASKEVKEKAIKAAAIIKESKHVIAFTGAGISTSAGIGDYRGKSGKWTEEERRKTEQKVRKQELVSKQNSAEGETSRKRRHSVSFPESNEDEEVDYVDLRPTLTHEALSFLVKNETIKHVISQNCDGLHGLSGIPAEHLSELHGNIFAEKCEKCEARYERDYYVMDDDASAYFEELEDNGTTNVKKKRFFKQCETCKLCHRTGRLCDKSNCNGHLMDTIINFGDDLEANIVDKARTEARKTDLILCLGTSLTVTPANSLVGKKTKLIFCNRQKTDFDAQANRDGVRVFSDCDRFVDCLMLALLGEEEHHKWKSERGERMVNYDKKRTQND